MSLLRHRSRHLRLLLSNLSLSRSMGGGPRTFPGGLSKWQYKRMHEKLAREKERKLLHQEKQLYQARLRSEIRAKLVAGADPSQSPSSSADFSPMSSREHIKALADRFMKDGAEDLWNDDDGPVRSRPRLRVSSPASPSPPLDVRKLVEDRRGRKVASSASFNQRREFSVVSGRGIRWRDNISSEEEEEDAEVRKDLRFLRLGAQNEEESEESDLVGKRSPRKKMMSSAALRNYDAKKERRALKHVEEEISDFSNQIRQLRDELRNREPVVGEKWQREVKEGSILTQKRFDEFDISPLTVKALADAGYVHTTVVQEAALPVCLEGKDALVKARTGTGKSAAFLLPAIEAALKTTRSNMNLRVSPIVALILCPTRELAIQVAAESNVLLRYHDGIGVQSLIGGTRFKLDQKRLESNPCQILVATPGRLLDHIENKSGFSVRLMGLKLLILDEADHLLDLGFRKDIEKLVDCLPRQRQSLLFSATIPKEVRRVSQLVLKRDHIFVDTVGLGGIETPAKVLQSYLVAPHEQHFHLVHHLLQEHIIQEPDYKIIVFCTTAMVTAFMYIMLRELKMNVREIHSRKPQLYRTRISDEFRESKRLILVTSDVSARGINYPDVTLVIQVGIPSDREQYIHRLGRTGREGKDGKGILLLAPWEEYFLDEIKDLPIERSLLPELDSNIKQKVEDSIGTVDTSIKEAAYHAWLGYYNSITEIGRDKTMLAELATRFSCAIGLEKPPALFRKTALKMGLKDIPGIRIRK
ncbi:DEAD-box ATP-dependent RNA helicase 48-like [Typha angustifolia]|uniref:DEAD-box ATP-dependent RNA helicase 48-like n=1 Tax=Typha angustifolia TaxID=59011 RepID=UPI003C2B61B1